MKGNYYNNPLNYLILATMIATDAHQKQTNKREMLYRGHPIMIAKNIGTTKGKIVAILNDVIKYSDYTLEDFELYGFSEDIIKAIKVLNKKEDCDYNQYILKIKANPLARKVKIENLKCNLNAFRADRIILTKELLKKHELDKKSLAFLTD